METLSTKQLLVLGDIPAHVCDQRGGWKGRIAGSIGAKAPGGGFGSEEHLGFVGKNTIHHQSWGKLGESCVDVAAKHGAIKIH